MREWRSGPEWDTRTLSELDGYEILATCQACGHVSKLNPKQLRRRQPRHFSWIAIGRRLKCDACDEKAAKLRLVPARDRRSREVHFQVKESTMAKGDGKHVGKGAQKRDLAYVR